MPGTQGYKENAKALADQYEMITLAEAHRDALHLFPQPLAPDCLVDAQQRMLLAAWFGSGAPSAFASRHVFPKSAIGRLHINLTGDYRWAKGAPDDHLRPLRQGALKQSQVGPRRISGPVLCAARYAVSFDWPTA